MRTCSTRFSVIKNTWSTLSGGAARHSSPLAVNGNVACANSTIDQEVYWAVYQNGANIVNRSASNGLSTSRYFDYWMTKSPYPTFVASSGNDRGTVASLLRNGPVVGGADDHGSTSRTGLTMYDFGAGNGSAWQNYSTGWELPHVVAPAVNIDTVSNFPAAGVRQCTGTSFAAPQVSGIVASLMETSPILKTWPEIVLPMLLVSSFTDASPDGPDGNSFSAR